MTVLNGTTWEEFKISKHFGEIFIGTDSRHRYYVVFRQEPETAFNRSNCDPCLKQNKIQNSLELFPKKLRTVRLIICIQTTFRGTIFVIRNVSMIKELFFSWEKNLGTVSNSNYFSMTVPKKSSLERFFLEQLTSPFRDERQTRLWKLTNQTFRKHLLT